MIEPKEIHVKLENLSVLRRYGAGLFALLLSSLSFGLTSCASIEGRCLTPAGALTIPTELPPPKDPNILPGGLQIKVDSPMLLEDPDFAPLFVAKLNQMGEGRFRSVKGTGKKPQYIIRITEMTEGKGFKRAEIEAIVAGALAGNLAGRALHRRGAGTAGAAAGAALAYFAFGEKKNTWAFDITVEVATSESGRSRLDSSVRNRNTDTSGMGDKDVGMVSSNRKNAFNSINTTFNVKSHVYRMNSKVVCLGKGSGLFSSMAERKKAARKAFLNRVPVWLFGGQDIGF